MGLSASSESSDLLVAHMYPLDLALAADRVGEAIQAVADDAVYSLDASGNEGFRKLISDSFGHSFSYPCAGSFVSGVDDEPRLIAGQSMFSTLRTPAVSARRLWQRSVLPVAYRRETSPRQSISLRISVICLSPITVGLNAHRQTADYVRLTLRASRKARLCGFAL